MLGQDQDNVVCAKTYCYQRRYTKSRNFFNHKLIAGYIANTKGVTAYSLMLDKTQIGYAFSCDVDKNQAKFKKDIFEYNCCGGCDTWLQSWAITHARGWELWGHLMMMCIF